MWIETDKEKPDDENIRLVVTRGSVGTIRNIAWYDIEDDCWETLTGERVNPILWDNGDLPSIPDKYLY